MSLEDILARPSNAYNRFAGGGFVRCKDGFRMSVITGPGTASTPIGQDEGPFTGAEVGFPTCRPEPWDVWQRYADRPGQPTRSVYIRVPAAIIRELVALHGGEK